MKKLTIEQVNEIKALRQEGKTLKELAQMFGVLVFTISWHTNQKFRERIKEYQRKWYSNMSSRQKKEYMIKRKDYQKQYHKNRYKTNEDFRKRQIERSKQYQKSKELKGGK